MLNLLFTYSKMQFRTFQIIESAFFVNLPPDSVIIFNVVRHLRIDVYIPKRSNMPVFPAP